MTPAPRTLAKIGRASVILDWLRELTAAAAAPTLSHSPATPGVGQSKSL